MFHLVSTHKLKRGGAACGEEVSESVILPLRHLDRVTCPSCLAGLRRTGAEIGAAADKARYSMTRAQVVRDAMTRAQRFGETKVFISSVWKEMGELTSWWGGSLKTFKAWLVDANRSGVLTMARADLVSAMDPELVAASEVTEGVSSWHFILDVERCPKCQCVFEGRRCTNPRCTRAGRG